MDGWQAVKPWWSPLKFDIPQSQPSKNYLNSNTVTIEQSSDMPSRLAVLSRASCLIGYQERVIAVPKEPIAHFYQAWF